MVLASEGELGRDQRGQALVTEQEAWLDREEIHDREARQAWRSLWSVVGGERLSAEAHRMEQVDNETE